MSQISITTKIKYIVVLLVSAMIWGTGFVAVEIALRAHMTPFFITAVRFAISAVVLSMYSRKSIMRTTKTTIKHSTVLGLVLFLAFAFQTIGLKYTTVSRNAFITATYVVMVPFLYWILYKKPPYILQLIAAFLTLIGVKLLNYTVTGETNIGDFLTIVSAFFFALHILLLGIYVKDNNPIVITTLQSIAAALFSFILMVVLRAPLPTINFNGIAAIIYLGVFSSSIAFSLQSIGQKNLSQITTSITLSTEAIFGTMFSVLLLKEKIGNNIIIGGSIMFCAIILAEIQQRPYKKKRTPSPKTVSYDDTAQKASGK